MTLFELVEKSRKGRDTGKLCDLFGVSTSGYYAWRKREMSEHQLQDQRLTDAIVEMHQGFRRAYGARRVHQYLRQKGFVCSVRRVSRLMKSAGIKASTVGLYTWSPGRNEFYSATENHLSDTYPAAQKGAQWAGDFTYIRTNIGWLYFAVVIDLFSRQVVGWSFSRKRNSEFTKSALRMALECHRPLPGCIFHSDQGVEYAAHEFRESIEAAGLTRSMSRKGTPLDNATVESFFHSMKSELVHQNTFENEIEAVAQIVHYIDFYNRERLHSSLGYQSPSDYEKLAA